MTISKIKKQLEKRELSCRELIQDFFERIKKKDGDIHAYLEINEEAAFKQADEIDAIRDRGGNTGVLGGVPVALKDNILTRDFKCTAGSRILESYEAPYDATVVRKLRDEGAIFIGKTNLDEFAMGSSTENSAFGPTKNPHDLERVPGGSSGGSAAAVSARMCVASLGSDTGGSIRQPAAFCGVVGFKPTYGAVSRYGLIAMASSLDEIGPITNTVMDARIVFDAIKGKDQLDATSLDVHKKRSNVSSSNARASGLKIGVPKEYFGEGIDANVKKSVLKAIGKYEENGAQIKEIRLPHTDYGLLVYYIVMPSEVSANLARYDGIRYGMQAANSKSDLLDYYLSVRKNGFGEEVRRRIMIGTYTLSSGYYDAYFIKAQKVRALIKLEFDKAFSDVDVIMTPATPTAPFKFGEKTKDPVSMYLSDIFTVGANLAGLPAITLPCAWVEHEGSKLPVSFQIIGPQKEDYRVLEVAELYETIS